MKTFKSESGTMPLPIDDTSSPTTVYVNENVTEVERTDEETGGTTTVYQYDVRLFTREEWEKLQIIDSLVDLQVQILEMEAA